MSSYCRKDAARDLLDGYYIGYNGGEDYERKLNQKLQEATTAEARHNLTLAARLGAVS